MRRAGARPGPRRIACAKRCSWRSSRSPDCAVVDLYAGLAGRSGIEALSRGAGIVDLRRVPRDAARRVLRSANLASLGAARPRPGWPLDLAAGLERHGARSSRTADLVLADPPYGGEEASRDARRSRRSPRLAEPGARVVLEHHAQGRCSESGRERSRESRERAYGETVVTTYRGRSAESARRRPGGAA